MHGGVKIRKRCLALEAFLENAEMLNQIVFYIPYLALTVVSFFSIILLHDWLEFFILYISLFFFFIFTLREDKVHNLRFLSFLGILYRLLPVLSLPQIPADDIFQYGTFGTRILQGLIPYKNFAAPYPPVALYVTVPFVLVGDLRFLKAFFSLCDILIAYVVCRILLRGNEKSDRIFVLLLFFPATLIEYSIAGHNDSLAVLLSISSLILLSKNVILSSAMMSFAVLCKIFPATLIPFLIRHLYSIKKKLALIYFSALIFLSSLISIPFILLSWNGYASMIIGSTRYSKPYGIIPSLLQHLLQGFEPARISYVFDFFFLGIFYSLIFVIAWFYKWSLMKSCSICLLFIPLFLPQFHPWYLLWASPFTIAYFKNNLRVLKSYCVLILFFNMVYYLIFSFN